MAPRRWGGTATAPAESWAQDGELCAPPQRLPVPLVQGNEDRHPLTRPGKRQRCPADHAAPPKGTTGTLPRRPVPPPPGGAAPPPPAGSGLQGREGAAGGDTASLPPSLRPSRPAAAPRNRSVPPLPSAPLGARRHGAGAGAGNGTGTGSGQGRERRGRCPAGAAMAAPATSAPPKKIVAPTVSQINAEFVTQVGTARRDRGDGGTGGGPRGLAEPGRGLERPPRPLSALLGSPAPPCGLAVRAPRSNGPWKPRVRGKGRALS